MQHHQQRNDSCNCRLEDSDNDINSKKINLGKKVIWFNTTFSKLLKINIDEYFLKLIERHFNKDNTLKNILKVSTLKIR